MDDHNCNNSDLTVAWPKFAPKQTVIGWKMLDLVDWVRASGRILDEHPGPENMPLIAMPPVQRSAVWRPKQVIDLWDSLMHGLPIGTFYLVERPPGARTLVPLGSDNTKQSERAGFDLLDGQQRVRALLIGTDGPTDEKRCLWVDLGAKTAGQSPCLRITSKAQPFGYDATTGNKLSLDDRRRARAHIEPCPKHQTIRVLADGAQRNAYDLDLFDGTIAPDGLQITQPPLPFGATPEKTFKFHELFVAWCNRSSLDSEGGIVALRGVAAGGADLDPALRVLNAAFQKVEEAQVALLRVEFRIGDPGLLTLFGRIGAGGTPLTAEEQLFSIYKYHKPEIRTSVNLIYQAAGRVLPATKIAVTALRIANALSSERNSIPSVADFAKEMAASPPGRFAGQLEKLMPRMHESEAIFSQGFVATKGLLAYKASNDAFWMPDVLLAALPAELWQVLVFWATTRIANTGQSLNPEDWENSRQEVVRFSLFWHLCVWNNEKAATWAFEEFRQMKTVPANFPEAELYKRLVGRPGSETCAVMLIPPCEFERRLCKEPSAGWRTDAERFVENNLRNDIGSTWWNSRKMLPWLQRNYVRQVFPDYVPLTDHEDDLPYDVDHICPWNDCVDWVSVRGRIGSLEQNISQRMHDGRGAIGNGIGNLRLIDSSINRQHQNVDIAEKMPFIRCDETPSDCDERAMADWAFPPEHRPLWRGVSRPGPVADRHWDNARLAAFQLAVEQRAAWLYSRFHDDLGYAAWTSAPDQCDASE